MSDCQETLQELYRFLDGELLDHRRHRVQAHLDGCLDCLQAFDFQAELRLVIARTCRQDELPASLVAKLESCFGPDVLAETDGGAPDDLGHAEPGR